MASRTVKHKSRGKKVSASILKAVEGRLSRYAKRAGELTAVGVLMYGLVAYVIPYLDRQWGSDPAPLEGRNEHLSDLKEEIKARQESDHAHDMAQEKITQQLQTTADTLAVVATKQQSDYKDNLAQQLERAQSALNTAKTFYEKDPSGDNERVVEAMRNRLMDLQRQLREVSSK